MQRTQKGSLLVLGGARSGKSRYAQQRAEALDGELVFIATAQALDAEMTDRITRHRLDRGARWHTVEAPIEIADAIAAESRADRVLLIDCLTLWASNLMFAERDIDCEVRKLTDAMARAPGPIILVANEVGLGIVPENKLARQFRDVAGSINQAVASAANEAIFVAAGLPMRLK
jgi:adenosylcobinamide kinase/adenosylcobinamide-phosphate guanylyltransferase